MAKLLKILAGFVLIIIAIVIIAPMVIDPNDYREQIQSAVKDNTGRDLTIDGDLSLSVFPWVGVGLNQVSLSNAAGFKADYFAKIAKANIQVKLLPLLSKKVEVSTIVINGMQLNLEKNKQGVSNWSDLSQASPQDAAPSKSSASADASEAAGLAALAIGGIQINDAQLSWSDASTGEAHTISDFNLTTDALSLGSAMAIQLGFALSSTQPALQTALALEGDLIINKAIDKFEFQNMQLSVNSVGKSIPNGEITMKIASNVIADLANSGSLALKPLSINFNETSIDGSLAVQNFSKPAINFDLTADTINVDQYFAESSADNTSQKTKKVVATPAATALIPVETIRSLNIDGLINIGSVVVSGLTADGVKLKVDAKNGVLKTQQDVSGFYNGSYAGKTTLNARGNTPKIILQEQASSIDIAALLSDLNGSEALSGTADIKANLTTQGNTEAALKAALNGTSNFSFKDGAITGVDAEVLMKQAQAVLKGDLSALAEKGSGKTPFTDISGSAKITNGLVNNRDLVVATPLINISGAGTANLVSENINYRLAMQRSKAAAESEKDDAKDFNNAEIPVNISGTFSEPKIKLDAKAIALSSQKEKIDEKKQQLADKIQEKLGDKIGGDLLKSFF